MTGYHKSYSSENMFRFYSVRSQGGDENRTRREASKAEEAGGGDELKSTTRPSSVSAHHHGCERSKLSRDRGRL
jgi:hypothetical protein